MHRAVTWKSLHMEPRAPCETTFSMAPAPSFTVSAAALKSPTGCENLQRHNNTAMIPPTTSLEKPYTSTSREKNPPGFNGGFECSIVTGMLALCLQWHCNHACCMTLGMVLTAKPFPPSSLDYFTDGYSI